MAPIPMSRIAARTVNPIRRIVDQMQVKPNSDKPVIPLSIGDPTVFGNFKLPESGQQALKDYATKTAHNGYVHSAGTVGVRETIAKKFGKNSRFPTTANDVYVTAGCSQALDISFGVLADPDKHNILTPRPGFSLYETQCSSRGIETRQYNLLPEKSWECDLGHMESLIDEKTAAILINNPSNPCGSNYSRSHLEKIVLVAQKYKLPIIADEIYANMVFKGQTFTSFDEISEDVPILSSGGLGKQYMVPGWRIGWVIAHDRGNRLKEVKQGLMDLTTITLGSSAFSAAMIKPLLEDTPASYYENVNTTLEHHAKIICRELSDTPGLRVVEPQAAMYIMIELDCATLGVKNDLEFSKLLIQEESVIVLPGECFNIPNFFRLVVTPPKDKLLEACERINDFCRRHAAKV